MNVISELELMIAPAAINMSARTHIDKAVGKIANHIDTTQARLPVRFAAIFAAVSVTTGVNGLNLKGVAANLAGDSGKRRDAIGFIALSSTKASFRLASVVAKLFPQCSQFLVSIEMPPVSLG